MTVVTSIQIGPLSDGEMVVLERPDGSPLEGFFGAAAGDWGITASTGSPYFDSDGATPGEQAVIGIDSSGFVFLESAVSAEGTEPVYASVELLTVRRESRESMTPVVDTAVLLEQQAARDVREQGAEPVDMSVPTRGADDGRDVRQAVNVTSDLSALEALLAARDVRQDSTVPVDASVPSRGDSGRRDRQSGDAVEVDLSTLSAQAAAREARQRPEVPKDTTEIEAALRAMRDARERDTNTGVNR